MRHIAIIGSGPAGFYTAEACQKLFGTDVAIDLIDRLPVPYGLIRSGVAPDHQSIKAVARRYEAIALVPGCRFVGNLAVGTDIPVDALAACYDAVVFATGAPADRLLDVPGADRANVFGSAAFVGWYNGHPDFADLDPDLSGAHAVIVGNGNVALDCARILAKTPDEFAGADIAGHALDRLARSGITRITILGRRGPHQIAMTPKELGELGELAMAQPVVEAADLPPAEADAALDPGARKSVAHLRRFADGAMGKARTIAFDFFASPVAIEGAARVTAMLVERTRLDGDRAVGTGDTYRLPADLIVSAIGYRTPPIPGVPYDAARGRFANQEGRIAPGLYCVGWARRGPSGTIGTNRPDGEGIAQRIADDWPATASGKAGGAGLDALIAARGLRATSFADWQAIDAAEIARARPGAPREKFATIADMLRVVKG